MGILLASGTVFSQQTSRSVPIAYAAARAADGRAQHEGETVTVVGTASVDSNVLSSNVFRLFIQDHDGGVAVFSRRPLSLVRAGDVIRVSGRVTSYLGGVEIVVDTVEALSHGSPPQPHFVRPSELLGGRYYGRLVRIDGQILSVSPRGRAVEARIQSGGEAIVLRLGERQKASFPPLEVGTTVGVIGVSAAFRPQGAARIQWQVLPRVPSDVEVIARAAPFTRAAAVKAAVVGAIAVGLVLLWNLTLRLRVRRAMKEHEESEARFRAVAETAPVAIVIYQDSVVRYVNRAAEQITGYTEEELVGRPFWEIVDPEFQELVRSQGQARLLGEAVPPRYEFRIRCKDGRSAWLDFSAAAIRYSGNTAALGTAYEVTERKHSEGLLRESERRFRALVENSSDGILLMDRDGRVTWAGPSTRRMLGIGEAELVGTDVAMLAHPDDRGALASAVAGLVAAPPGPSPTIAYRGRGDGGDWRWFEMTLSNLLDDPPVGALVGNYRDITERRQAEEEIRHQALHDPLTGLPNRDLYHDRLGLAIAHARRTGRPLAVMFVDLDLFKLVNDTLGHTLGDRLLQLVAARLRDCVRASDTVARVGGDEFTILVEDLQGVDDASRIAEAVLERIAQPCLLGDHELHATASIGVSIFPTDGDDPDTLTRNADTAMYRAKELGRHGAQLFTPDMDERYRARLAFETGFRRALDRGEFVLHYQAIHAAAGAVAGAEALARWNDPVRGIVYPDAFISAAEESRMIVPLGAWVLRTACEQAAAWAREGLPALRVSVNLSVRQFHQRVLLRTIDEVLRETHLDPRLLQLEVTESVAMQNVDLTRTLLGELRGRGISVAIDDFGAGHSALIYLRQFPIDTIKIDRAFVRHVSADSSDAAIVSAIIKLAHDLGLSVVAEGVETKEQRSFLVAEGCDFLQGYLFGRPLPAHELRPTLLASAPTTDRTRTEPSAPEPSDR